MCQEGIDAGLEQNGLASLIGMFHYFKKISLSHRCKKRGSKLSMFSQWHKYS